MSEQYVDSIMHGAIIKVNNVYFCQYWQHSYPSYYREVNGQRRQTVTGIFWRGNSVASYPFWKRWRNTLSLPAIEPWSSIRRAVTKSLLTTLSVFSITIQTAIHNQDGQIFWLRYFLANFSEQLSLKRVRLMDQILLKLRWKSQNVYLLLLSYFFLHHF